MTDHSAAIKLEESTRVTHHKTILDKNPFYLGKYFLANIGIYSLGVFFLLWHNNFFETYSYGWIFCLLPLFVTRVRYIMLGSLVLSVAVLYYFGNEISWYYIALFPMAIYLGHLSPVLIHNASHKNFKPKWLNPIVGEICALQQVSAGLPVFQLIHTEHHIFSDDVEKDPHPVKGYTFFSYIDAMRGMIIKKMGDLYFQSWGNSPRSIRLWSAQLNLMLVSRFAKNLFLFCLLGPKIFTLLFLPSYISNILIFCVFNYYTHTLRPDGSAEIRNLNNNWYYRIGNKILFGVFYHKNHHLKPKLFNPAHLRTK